MLFNQLQVYCLFHDSASSSENEVSNGRFNEQLLGEDVGRGGHGLIQVLDLHFHKGTKENHPKLSLISQSLGQNVNPDPHIFKMNSDRNSSLYCNDNGLKSGFQKQDLLKIWFKIYDYTLIIKRMQYKATVPIVPTHHATNI